jgi:hypothetical protein
MEACSLPLPLPPSRKRENCVVVLGAAESRWRIVRGPAWNCMEPQLVHSGIASEVGQ